MPSHPLYHLYRHKKIINIRKPLFPSKWVKLLDKVAFTVGILGPLTAIFQSYEIWSTHSAESVSLIAWLFPLCFNIPLFFYGLVHRVKLMMIIYTCWFCVNASVVLGIVLYS